MGRAQSVVERTGQVRRVNRSRSECFRTFTQNLFEFDGLGRPGSRVGKGSYVEQGIDCLV